MNPEFPCREMPTRHCPAVYHGVCGDGRLCARFESSDETPWWPEIKPIGEKAASTNLDGFDLLALSGDENGGVGIGCRDHWDGGRPLGYLGYGQYPDPLVVDVDTIAELLAVGRRHLDEKHRTEISATRAQLKPART